MKQIGRSALIAIVLLVGLIAATLLSLPALFNGFSARSEPNAVEAAIAQRVRRMAIPRDARDRRSPVDATPDVMSAAMAHYADHCAVCHANDGSGDTMFGKGMYPKPPDMRLRATQELSDGELYFIIQNGIRFTGMPAFGESSDPNDMDTWGLVKLIRRLPNITAEELELMRGMNPISPAEMRQQEEIQRFLRGEDVEFTETHQH